MDRKSLPYSNLLEMEAIYTMTSDSKNARNFIIDIGIDKIKDGFFYNAIYFNISIILIDYLKKDKPINIYTILEELKTRFNINQSTENKILSEYFSIDINYNLERKKEIIDTLNSYYYRRKTLIKLYELEKNILKTNYEPENLHSEIIKLALSETPTAQNNKIIKVSEIMKDFINNLNNPKNEGITTTYKFIDDYYLFSKGELIIIAGSTSIGKSSLALSLAMRLNYIFSLHNQNKVILYITIEMERLELLRRLISMIGKIPLWNIKKNNYQNIEDLHTLQAVAKYLEKSDIYIIEAEAMDINNIIALIKWIKYELELQQKEIGIVFIDYIQQVKHYLPKANREQTIADIVSQLKYTALNLKIPIVALAQLNRNVEKREEKEPILSDLRESGAIEQYADAVFFVYKTEEQQEYSKHNKIYQVNLKLAKNRNGEKDKIFSLYFHSLYTYFNSDELMDDIDIEIKKEIIKIKKELNLLLSDNDIIIEDKGEETIIYTDF